MAAPQTGAGCAREAAKMSVMCQRSRFGDEFAHGGLCVGRDAGGEVLIDAGGFGGVRDRVGTGRAGPMAGHDF